jgi:hypothetical protein
MGDDMGNINVMDGMQSEENVDVVTDHSGAFAIALICHLRQKCYMINMHHEALDTRQVARRTCARVPLFAFFRATGEALSMQTINDH